MRTTSQQGPEASTPAVYITANSLVTDGATMDDALQTAHAAGVDGFEVRRELLPANWSPMEADGLRDRLAEFRAPAAYSTPQALFTAGQLERDRVQRALAGAVTLGCQIVKFQPGSGEAGRGAVAALAGLLGDWRCRAPNLVVTVENDQQRESADLHRWERLFNLVDEVGCPLRMTFDLGNWAGVGANQLAAAELLGPRVAYVHLKAVEYRNGRWETRPIRRAEAVHPVLNALPSTAPRAIEFSIPGGGRAMRVHALQAYVAWIRSGRIAVWPNGA